MGQKWLYACLSITLLSFTLPGQWHVPATIYRRETSQWWHNYQMWHWYIYIYNIWSSKFYTGLKCSPDNYTNPAIIINWLCFYKYFPPQREWGQSFLQHTHTHTHTSMIPSFCSGWLGGWSLQEADSDTATKVTEVRFPPTNSIDIFHLSLGAGQK